MDENNIINSFSEILIQEKSNNKKLTSTIVEGLDELGIHVSPRIIQMYIKGDIVPSFEVAKNIFKIIKIDFSDLDVIHIIDVSNRKKRNRGVSKYIANSTISGYNKSDRPKLNKTISIGCDEFDFLDGSNIPKEDSIELINERIEKEYGSDRGAFNRYIKDLINDDMKK